MCDDIEAFVAAMKTRDVVCGPVQNQGWGVADAADAARRRHARRLSAAARAARADERRHAPSDARPAAAARTRSAGWTRPPPCHRGPRARGFSSITRTRRRAVDRLRDRCGARRGAAQRGYRGLVVRGPLDFSLVGIVASLAGALAAAAISIFVVSTTTPTICSCATPTWIAPSPSCATRDTPWLPTASDRGRERSTSSSPRANS